MFSYVNPTYSVLQFSNLYVTGPVKIGHVKIGHVKIGHVGIVGT